MIYHVSRKLGVTKQKIDEFLNENQIKLDCVLDVNVPAEILVRRMVGRRVCKGCGATFHVEFNAPKQEGICDVCGTPLIQYSRT